MPDDLAEALAADPKAQAMFEQLTRQNRYAVLYRVTTAKRAETRARRIDEFVAMLARGETPYPQKRRARTRDRRSANGEVLDHRLTRAARSTPCSSPRVSFTRSGLRPDEVDVGELA